MSQVVNSISNPRSARGRGGGVEPRNDSFHMIKSRNVSGMKAKPQLFVGSSVENLQVAYDVQENLDHDAEVKVWPQGGFEIAGFGLDSLLEQLQSCDFGVFIFTPDDMVRIREEEHRAVRDNVLFELGLFMGRLGRQRTFVIVPSGIKVHLPSDLIGWNLAYYDPNRKDGVAALGVACNKIRRAMAAQKVFRPEAPKKEVFSTAAPIENTPPFPNVATGGIRQQPLGPAPSGSTPAKRLRDARSKPHRKRA